MKVELSIKKLQLSVFLGWGLSERRQPQSVLVDLTVSLTRLPAACMTDELSDTVCYAELAKRLQLFCHSKQFKLLEYLGYELFTYTKSLLNTSSKLSMTINKISPDSCSIGIAQFSLKDD